MKLREKQKKNKLDLKLLTKSRKHWQENCDAKSPAGASIRAEECALCGEYLDGSFASCRGCPIAEHTGLELCAGTPYQSAVSARKKWGMTTNYPKRRAWILVCRRMLEFLDMLIEKHQQILTDDNSKTNG